MGRRDEGNGKWISDSNLEVWLPDMDPWDTMGYTRWNRETVGRWDGMREGGRQGGDVWDGTLGDLVTDRPTEYVFTKGERRPGSLPFLRT